MRSMTTLVCLTTTVVVTLGAATAAAAGPAPFSRLFLTPEQDAQDRNRGTWRQLPTREVPPRVTASVAPPRVLCGTTVVPVDPDFDAGIRQQAPLHPRPAAPTMPALSCQTVK